MICWKPVEVEGKDIRNHMQCRHCHRIAHRDHLLQWLEKKDYCPVCKGKL